MARAMGMSMETQNIAAECTATQEQEDRARATLRRPSGDPWRRRRKADDVRRSSAPRAATFQRRKVTRRRSGGDHPDLDGLAWDAAYSAALADIVALDNAGEGEW